ncbi:MULTISPECIES: hypothetical protein [Sorangium]|uniref:Uncharacterized protein n=1 Tax=Sorangium cellulosum TaxID=56 RepID=A0A4P2QJS4_SORCE|nr:MULTISPECIES: hypothetical protein [Sorangium]AUX30234.1 hypothetical protein SOCE836_023330 [Sorangium cellulosum]WCQ89627.1 hypothetical protein NQZ70_02318 [Sorangium sp. Soce836]
MIEAPELPDLSPDDAHPRAAAALADPFFWSLTDETAPFGNETAHETLTAFRDFRDEHPKGSPLELLDALLARWEVESAHWNAVDAAEVQALGEEDEYGLLTRDEAILALAFSQIVTEGRLDPEVRRRALLALARQALPALLSAFEGRALERALRIDRMRAVLAERWE